MSELRYELTMTIDDAISEDQQEAVYDALGDRFDSASISGGTIQLDGTIRQKVQGAYLMLDIRQALDWPRNARFAVSYSEG